jgi:hypothetical protein
MFVHGLEMKLAALAGLRGFTAGKALNRSWGAKLVRNGLRKDAKG